MAYQVSTHDVSYPFWRLRTNLQQAGRKVLAFPGSPAEAERAAVTRDAFAAANALRATFYPADAPCGELGRFEVNQAALACVELVMAGLTGLAVLGYSDTHPTLCRICGNRRTALDALDAEHRPEAPSNA